MGISFVFEADILYFYGKNVSLQELMDEDELLQECISQNKKVIDYLTQPETLEALVSYVVTDPSPDRELKVRFKYANLASELLTSDVPAIVEKVASSSNLLQMLYQFLEKEKPLNPLLASFVSKVFGMLVQRRSEQNWYSYQFTCFQVLDFLKSRGDFVELAVKHIGTSAIMDLLIKLICGVDDDNQELKRGIHQWLNESHLVEQLVEKLAPDCDSEEHSSVDQLLCELIIKGQDTPNGGSDSQTNGSQSRLLGTLESKDVINKLMDTLLHEERSESSVSHVINILLTLLSYRGSHKQSNIHHNSIDTIDGDLDSRNTVLKTVVSRLPDLQKILKQPTKLGKLTTAYGMEVERLGSTRLKVELFFKFSLNNFLHTQVTHCIACILGKPLVNGDGAEVMAVAEGIDGLNNNPKQIENGETNPLEGESDKEMDRSEATHEAFYHPLLLQLFSECKIIQKILECYVMEEESATEKRLHNLIGYMGHIREMANDIVQYSKEGPCGLLIQNEIKKLPDDVITQWEEFTLIGLAEG
ncbi:Serine/threonine-protein phosphatase 6 regulatory subunit 3 [Armadillidium nasatum]|uniref:Serine/threonine-protein phosphatase 6 regulatory subunit 3 n=1 Tax=Armadillidium nasatum TaxID=96803 RepID=A0A5N5SYS8_9CRUS|nr:Serine/threonine-protein phosphatase 6 regulatory subunit 3 [Armadillidium nasatum]